MAGVRFQLRNCGKPASWHFQQKWKIHLKCDYSLSWPASTSRVLFPVWNATRKAKKEWLILLPPAPCLDDLALEIISEVSCVHSWIFEWAEGGCIKEKKGLYYGHLVHEKKWSSSSLKGPFWPCLIILLLVYAFHTKTLYPPMHSWTSLVAQSRYFILTFIHLEWDHPAKLSPKAAATWKK